MQKHSEWLDILKGFAIFLVVVGHSCPVIPIEDSGSMLYVYIWRSIFFFHMPLMFMISGWLSLKVLDNIDKVAYICDRFKRLMIPYFTIAFSYVALKLILFKFVAHPYQLSDMGRVIGRILLGYNPLPVMWFVWVLFIIQVILVLVISRKNLDFILLLSAMLWAVVKFGNWHFYANVLAIGQYFFFVVLGLWLRVRYDKVLSGIDLPIEKFRCLAVLGKHTMDIYIFHAVVIMVVKIVAWNHLHWSFWPCSLTMTTLGVILPLLISKYFVRKSRFLTQFILGEGW